MDAVMAPLKHTQTVELAQFMDSLSPVALMAVRVDELSAGQCIGWRYAKMREASKCILFERKCFQPGS